MFAGQAIMQLLLPFYSTIIKMVYIMLYRQNVSAKLYIYIYINIYILHML